MYYRILEDSRIRRRGGEVDLIPCEVGVLDDVQERRIAGGRSVLFEVGRADAYELHRLRVGGGGVVASDGIHLDILCAHYRPVGFVTPYGAILRGGIGAAG